MSNRLDGKVALVSGGARGMGAAHARGFVDEGAAVVIGDILSDEGSQLAAELGERAHFVELDVTSEESWVVAVGAAESRFGGLDVLVNNAGVAPQDLAGVVEMSLDEYMRVVMVNQVGVFLGMHVGALPIIRRGGGSIINISSIAGLMGSPAGVHYTASKFAVRGMTKTAALELAPFNVRVNSVHPGIIDTPMLAIPADADLSQMYESMVPLRCMGEPTDVANLILFLASSDSRFCTGAEFVIDGGQAAGSNAREMVEVVSQRIRSLL